MARPRKTGLDYFPHDVNVTTDPKIEPAIMRYGAAAYAFFFVHLEYCYRSDNLSVDISATEAGEEMRKVIQKKLKIGKKQYDNILKSFLRHGAFNVEVYFQTGHLTSNGIKKRAEKVFEKRAISNRCYKNTIGTFITETGVSATETMSEIEVSTAETMSEIEVSATETMPETPQSIVKKRIVKKRIEEKDTPLPPKGGDVTSENLTTLKMVKPISNNGDRKDNTTEGKFLDFWAVYPKKIGKKAAFAAWKRLKPDAALYARILAAVEAAKKSKAWQRDHGQYIPHPTTWLNQGRWDDEIQSPEDDLLRKYASFLAATDEKTKGEKQ